MDDLARRREAVIGAIDRVGARLVSARAELREAPAWFRPGLDGRRLPRARALQFERLNSLVRDAELDADLLDRLRRERTAIELGRISPLRCWDDVIAWLNRVHDVRELLAGIVRDPFTEIEQPRPTISVRDVEPVFELRERLGGRFDAVADLDPIAVADRALFEDLHYTGCWRVPQPLHRPDVDVLVPVRLETRFDPPAAGTNWELRIRVVPDDISIDRHDPVPSSVEVRSLALLWERSGGDLSTDEGKAAWARFVEVHGGRRAAWLARTHPPPADGTAWTPPTQVRDDPLVSALKGWPDQIEIWIARGGGTATRATTLTVDVTRLAFDIPSPDETDRRRWWNSFERARDVGMAATIDLGPARPDDIDVIYAIGRGTDSPSLLFEAHKEAGNLSILTLGTSTNTSDLQPTDEFSDDPEFWLEQATGAAVASPLEGQLSRALTGAPGALAPLPGGDRDDTPVSNAMVGATWSVLWHHTLADLWNVDVDSVQRAGLWASTNLAPEGPLPAIRVGDQPYGLLPITDLGAWRPGAGDPPIEARLASTLTDLRDIAALAAETRGTVVGADTDQLLSIVAQPPNSPDYASRWFVALEMWNWFLSMLGQGGPLSDLEQWWDGLHATPLGLGATPTRRHVAVGSPSDLELPLVVPRELPEGIDLAKLLEALAKIDPSVLVHGDGLDHLLVDGKLPASLLVRLVARAMILTAAEVERTRLKDPDPLIEPLAAPTTEFGRIEQLVLMFQPAHLNAGTPAAQLYTGARAAVLQLASFASEPKVLERVLRATLDTAMYRVDPWITGLAARRMRDLESQSPQHRLGVYGWVDRPRPGRPGPIPQTLVAAPDTTQAYTSAILRDRSLFDDEPGRWDMDIDSSLVQEASRIAAEVRIGSHIKEALGRRVERIARDPGTIDALRSTFPIRTEHDGRRTCDGEAVLNALADSPGLLPASLSATARAGVEELAAVMDAYADLLVAEAVHHVVSGRGETAGAAMEAAAGFGSPPDLEVIKTPRSGRAVNTNLLTAIPATAPIAASALTFETSPSLVAEPSVAAWLTSEVGPADGAVWTWIVIDDVTDEHNPVQASVTLDDLGMTPIDALALSSEALHELAATSQGPNFRTDRTVAAAPDATYREAQRRLAVLGRQPAVPADLAADGQLPDAQPVFDDLLGRLARLRQLATLLTAQLPVAVASADQAVKWSALLATRRWGITPLPEAGDIDAQLAAAQTAIQNRLTAAPSVGNPTLEDAAERLELPELARAITALATPEAQIPILSTFRLADLPQALTAVPQSATTGLSELDVEWLEVVSGVRDPAAVLSVFQLDRSVDPARSPWHAWTNRPGDPWQVAVDPNPPADELPATTRLVALYGPDGLLAGPPTDVAAVGLLDSWGETIPTTDHTVSAAFGFDAPGARAPQAVLIAVPPDVDRHLTTDALATMLDETRALARARVARPEDLSSLGSAAPLTMFQSQGRGAVDLELTQGGP